MSKVKYDEIQVGDLVSYISCHSNKTNLGYVEKVDSGNVFAYWSTDITDSYGYMPIERITGHWKVINFEEEIKVDELKVYTGKDTIDMLLEGKTLQREKALYRISKQGTLEVDMFSTNEWKYSRLYVSKLLTWEFTEVATPQVGDWVKVTRESGITYVGQIDEIIAESGDLYANWNGNASGYLNPHRNNRTWEILSPEQIAEYKREQVFAKVGRKLNEYRENDIVFLENTGAICMVTTKSNFNGNVGVKEINKPQKWNASVKQLEPITFAENLVSLS